MLMTLDALIQNGKGGRQSIVLRQIYALYVKFADGGDDGAADMFDAVMANAAADLDAASAAVLAPEMDSIAAHLPSLAAAVKERARNPKASAEPEHSLPVAERRTRPRDPIEDANNPITLARKSSPAELLMIAGIPNLPESITGVIVARGDRNALQRALSNPTASFSKSSLTTLAELAPSDRMIKETMLSRRDLPEPIVERLLPFLSADAKAGILMADRAFSEAEAQTALAQAISEQASADQQHQTAMSLENCIAKLVEGELAPDDLISMLARDARVSELAAFAAAQTGIRQVTALNILSGRLDHSVAILLRALDCGESAVDVVMTMRRRCACRETRETRSAYLASQRYSIASATEMLLRMDAVSDEPKASDTDLQDEMRFAA